MNEFFPLSLDRENFPPRSVTQDSNPCVLHKYHSPVTIINELHHPFPQAWQNKIWGKVKDHTTVSVDATTHNSIHFAIDYFENYKLWLPWCIGLTRDLAKQAFILRDIALKERF